MIQVYLYIDDTTQNVEDLKSSLSSFQKDFSHCITVVNISNYPYLRDKFQGKLPFIDIGPYRLTAPVSQDDIHFALKETQAKIDIAVEKKDTYFLSRFSSKPVLTNSEKRSYWFTKHYMLLFNLIVLLYVGLPFLAPIFMKTGLPGMAKPIYKIYSPLCHQLAFRSWFLFGEQIAYPRSLAGIDGLQTYAEVSGNNEDDLIVARDFLGNEQVGYKVALCQRDVAIYVGILLFGIFFSLLGKWVKPIPWYIWIIFGLIPIGLDGFSQLLSQTGWSIFSWLDVRESTPLFRTITGAMFGVFTAWYGYPYVREGFVEKRDDLELKFAIVKANQKVKKV